LPNLATLELRANRLISTAGIDSASLQELYLAENKIEKIEGLEKLTSLHTLHLRSNAISSLDGFASLTALKYLNLRDNQISEYSELVKLQPLQNLQTIILTGNPMCETEEYRLDVLMELRQLKKLDKEPFSPEDYEDAKEMLAEKQAEEEARKQALLAEEKLRKQEEDLRNQQLQEEQEYAEGTNEEDETEEEREDEEGCGDVQLGLPGRCQQPEAAL